LHPDLTRRAVGERVISAPVITPQTTVATALKLLREHDVPALPVASGGRFVGIVDERALLRLTPSEATTLDRYELHEVLDRLTVTRVIDTNVARVHPAAPLIAAAALMARDKRQIVAVVDGDRFVGLVRWTDLLAALLNGLEVMMPSVDGEKGGARRAAAGQA
jgi:acetoin utilization protein AcuB